MLFLLKYCNEILFHSLEPYGFDRDMADLYYCVEIILGWLHVTSHAMSYKDHISI